MIYISSVDNPKAVVILFGWIGAKKRHVEKYVEVYTKEHGCSVVYGTAPILAIMFRRHAAITRSTMDAVQKASKILRTENENDKGDGSSGRNIPVVVHHFSNGGAFLAERLDLMIKEANKSDLARKEANANADAKAKTKKSISSNGFGPRIQYISRSKQPEVIKDCLLIQERLHDKGFEILDSSPVYVSNQSVYGAMEGLIQMKPLQILAKVCVSIGMFLTFLSEIVLCRESWKVIYWNNMMASELCQRQAFVYSSSDTITDPLKIDELIEVRKKRGVDVSVHKFEDSSHVAHFKKYPDEYRSIIESVLKQIEEEMGDDTSC